MPDLPHVFWPRPVGLDERSAIILAMIRMASRGCCRPRRAKWASSARTAERFKHGSKSGSPCFVVQVCAAHEESSHAELGSTTANANGTSSSSTSPFLIVRLATRPRPPPRSDSGSSRTRLHLLGSSKEGPFALGEAGPCVANERPFPAARGKSRFESVSRMRSSLKQTFSSDFRRHTSRRNWLSKNQWEVRILELGKSEPEAWEPGRQSRHHVEERQQSAGLDAEASQRERA